MKPVGSIFIMLLETDICYLAKDGVGYYFGSSPGDSTVFLQEEQTRKALVWIRENFRKEVHENRIFRIPISDPVAVGKEEGIADDFGEDEDNQEPPA